MIQSTWINHGNDISQSLFTQMFIKWLNFVNTNPFNLIPINNNNIYWLIIVIILRSKSNIWINRNGNHRKLGRMSITSTHFEPDKSLNLLPWNIDRYSIFLPKQDSLINLVMDCLISQILHNSCFRFNTFQRKNYPKCPPFRLLFLPRHSPSHIDNVWCIPGRSIPISIIPQAIHRGRMTTEKKNEKNIIAETRDAILHIWECR